MYSTQHKRRQSQKKFLLPAIVVAGIIILMLILELTNTTHVFHKKRVPATIPVATRQNNVASTGQSQAKKPSSTLNSTAQTDSQTSKQSSSTGGSGSNLPLIQPYGSFVSNHRPGQDGSPTTEQSTCNTTSGATCYIQLTNTATNVTTKLPPQPVDSGNTTTWSWDANKLTSGSWQIVAVATLNGQTKTTTDPTSLEVQ
jgi:cytoskeletal protein RodZ